MPVNRHEAERALFELQRGRAIHITAAGGQDAYVAAVEGLAEETLRRFHQAAEVRLALTGYRARAMGLVAEEDGPEGLSLRLDGRPAPAEVFRLASARAAYDGSPVGLRDASTAEARGLTLTRLGRLLPAVVSVAPTADARPAVDGAMLSVEAADVDALAADTRLELTHVSDGPVPLAVAERARFMAFREGNGILEHVAVLIGDPEQWPDPLPVRIHSACLTGDLFGSLRCDCGEQLQGSLGFFASRGGGVLLYLDQEGRGIGLGNKLRAYTLQGEGLDTVDADCTLGFGADERSYVAAVEMLRHLGIQRVQLLTNNPEKIRAIREGGVEVTERQPLYGTLNQHNVHYVRAKVNRAGHWLGDMLSGAVPGK